MTEKKEAKHHKKTTSHPHTTKKRAAHPKSKKHPEEKPEAVQSEASATAVVVKKSSQEANNYQKGVQYIEAGKRKNATARVVLRPGSGKFLINSKHTLESYFGPRALIFSKINKPFKVSNMENQYDTFINVNGGGKHGQAGAIAHGIAKAIVVIKPDIKKQLKLEGLITRDSRVKESKKYGRKKARKGRTYRKR